MPQTLSRARPFWLKSIRVSFSCKSRHLWVQHLVPKAVTSHVFTPLCSSTSHLFTSCFCLVYWSTLKIANDLPIFASYYASYYAFVIVSLTWLAYFLSRDYLFHINSLGFLFIFCFSLAKGKRLFVCMSAIQKNIFLTRLERLI